MFLRFVLIVGFVAFAAGFRNAQAELVYELFFRTAAGDGVDSRVTVAPGETFTNVQAILRETISGTSDSLLGSSNLNAFNAQVLAAGSDGGFSERQTDGDGGNVVNGNSPDRFTFTAFSFAGQPGKAPNMIDAAVREVTLGSLTLTAPTAGETTFTLADGTIGDGDFTVFSNVMGLERLARDSGGGFFGRSLTLAATVPEPSSLAFLGLLGGGMVLRRRRR